MGQVVPNWQELKILVDARRTAGDIIVTTNGIFDVLHVGHARYLQQAAALGGCLVIGVNTDACTSTLKGPTRPIVPQEERAEMLAALKCVDFVTFFGESTPEALLAVLQPDIHVKGGDYDIEAMPETVVVRSHGGRVVTLPFVAGRSTTNIVERILSAHSVERNDAC